MFNSYNFSKAFKGTVENRELPSFIKGIILNNERTRTLTTTLATRRRRHLKWMDLIIYIRFVPAFSWRYDDVLYSKPATDAYTLLRCQRITVTPAAVRTASQYNIVMNTINMCKDISDQQIICWSSKQYVDNMLTICWEYVDNILTLCWSSKQYIDNMLTICRQYIDNMLIL